MSTLRIVVVGDALLDRDIDGSSTRLAPDAPVPVVDVATTRSSPGGAGLAALLCAEIPADQDAEAPAVEVTLLAPLADDEAGRELVATLGPVRIARLGHRGATRTKTRVRSGGHGLARLDEGGPGTPVDVDADHVARVLAAADAVLVSDYGGGITHDPAVRAALTDHARAGGIVVWDPHPRGAPPVPGCALVTPNRAEAEALCGPVTEESAVSGQELAARLREQWDAHAVVVTAGGDGAHLATADASVHVPARAVHDGDPCGAGDRFASAAALALAAHLAPPVAVERAVAASGQWVAAGGAAAFRARTAERPAAHGLGTDLPIDVRTVVEDVRRRGGRLVATGGCFDVLHAGHVRCLEEARRLGDALVVLLNSDDSVRRLKGPDRPVTTQDDRIRILQALRSVAAVLVFEEDDPRVALRRLGPDVWVKGGDYDPRSLPETEVVEALGGVVVTLPQLPGRSTTAILETVRGLDDRDPGSHAGSHVPEPAHAAPEHLGDGDVLVLRALGLGDALTGIAPLRGIRRLLPDHRIVLAAPEGIGAWLTGLGLVDAVLPSSGLADLPTTGGGHMAVNLHGRGPRSHAVLEATGPRRLIAFADPVSGRHGPRWCADEHEVDRWCRLVTAAGGPCGPADLRLRAHHPVMPGAPVVLHPGAAAGSRRWPRERWRTVAAALARAGHRVLITGSEGERELARAVAVGIDGVTDLSGTLDLDGLTRNVSRASLVLSGDTGIAHLATALAVPSVVLFGPTPPALWGPRIDPELHTVLWHGSTGPDADRPGDPHAEALDPRLERVTVTEVLEAAAHHLAARPPAPGGGGAGASELAAVPCVVHPDPIEGAP